MTEVPRPTAFDRIWLHGHETAVARTLTAVAEEYAVVAGDGAGGPHDSLSAAEAEAYCAALERVLEVVVSLDPHPPGGAWVDRQAHGAEAAPTQAHNAAGAEWEVAGTEEDAATCGACGAETVPALGHADGACPECDL